jgi:hypothetical protein
MRVPNPRCVGGVGVGPPDSVQRKLSRPSAVRMRFQRRHPPSIAIRILPLGREFMQGDCNRLSRIRLQHYGGPVNSYAPLSLAPVGQKLLGSQSVKLGARPTRFHEQRMDFCERINTPFYQFLEIIGRIGMRKPHGRLHGSQDVLCSMLGLVREIDDLSLAPFALRYVASDFRCTDDLAPSVSDRRNGQRNVDQTPMLALPNGFIGSTRRPLRIRSMIPSSSFW